MAKVFKDPGPARKAEWLREHPGDEGRFVAAFSEEAGGSGGSAVSAPSRPAMPVAAPGAGVAPAGAAPATPPSMTALNKVVTPGVTAPDASAVGGISMGLGGGAPDASGGLLQSATGALRPLGRRMLPMSAMVLGQKAY